VIPAFEILSQRYRSRLGGDVWETGITDPGYSVIQEISSPSCDLTIQSSDLATKTRDSAPKLSDSPTKSDHLVSDFRA
jgi:hypothetical protein